MSEQKKPEKKYTAEFRESAVKLAVGSEQPISKTAQELGINKNTLHTWIGKYHIRALTRRTRGRRLDHIIAELRETLLG
ncbi:MAG: transposase [Gammaproteobacteria bacterium]|nr:transposase [Gammaproteobacteria bacterium]